MREINVFLLTLLTLGVLGGSTQGATLETGTQIGPSTGTNYYTVYFWQINYTSMTVNSTNITFTGLNTNSDVFTTVQGLLCLDSTTCTNIGHTNTSDNLIIHDLVWNTTGIDILSMTGNLTNMTVCYNSSSVGNFTLVMEDQGGDCNYGSFNAPSNTSNIYLVWFDRKIAAFTECNITLQTNGTAQTEVCIHVFEDESMSETTLATILAAIGITVLLISKGHQWDTED